MTANPTPAGPPWTSRLAGRNLTRVAGVSAAALAFSALVLLVRLRWVPLVALASPVATRWPPSSSSVRC